MVEAAAFGMLLRRSVGSLCAAASRYIRLKQPKFSIPIPYLPKQSPQRPQAVKNSAATEVTRISELLSNPSPNLFLQILNQFGSSHKPVVPFLTWLQKHPGCDFSIEVFNATIDSLGESREFEPAWRMIHDQIQGDPSRIPNFDTFAIMIKRSTQADAYREAIRAFEYASALDLFNDSDSQNKLLEVLLDSLCNEGHVRIASQYVSKKRVKDPSFSPSIRTYEILLNGWFLSRKLESAEHLWIQMKEENVKPTVVTYRVLIAGFCRNNQLGRAMEMFDVMRHKGFEPNATVYNPIIRSLGEARRFKEALGMLERFSILELGPTEVTYNSLVKSFCNAGDLLGACEIVRMMIRSKCLPSSVTYSYFFKHFSKEGMIDWSLDLYVKMIRSGYEPDRVTYNLVMKMLCEDGNLELVKQIRKEMRARGYDLDLATGIKLFNLLCRLRAYDEAVSEFEGMLCRGHVPRNQTYMMIRKDLEKKKMTETVKKLDHRMASLQHSTDLLDSSHERASLIIKKAESISGMVKQCKNPRVLVKRHRPCKEVQPGMDRFLLH